MRSFVLIGFLFIAAGLFGWGFHAHRLINDKASLALPSDLLQFYKNHSAYLSEHAVDPDIKRSQDKKEGPNHYIDIDHYDSIAPFDSMPKTWTKAVQKYSEDTLREYGILPWHINSVYHQLVKAFTEKDKDRILKLSADLGHYAADASVPLHTTENYDGQFTNQRGIHKLWESKIPEKFSKIYELDFEVAGYIASPLNESWAIIKSSHSKLDSVLLIEKEMRTTWAVDSMHAVSRKGVVKKKEFSKKYISTYEEKLNGMVERQLKIAIKFTSSLWYSAWVEAGQPKLD